MATDLGKLEAMAIHMMKDKGLIGWSFEWFDGRRMAGQCNYTRKTIRLSRFLYGQSEQNIKNIILHEIAHALTPGHNHDEEWQRVAISIGCDGARCHNLGALAMAKYHIECPCGACKIDRFRMTTKMKRSVCRKCRGALTITTL